MAVRFEWDETKNRANVVKHGISFETAKLVFDDPHVVSFPERNVEGFPHEKQVHRNGNVMPTKKQKKELEALAAMPDTEIDFSDIPEITDKQWAGAVRGLFARPETKHISIRLSAVDLVLANKLAAAKGLPYQTYIKSLLHESLVRENSK